MWYSVEYILDANCSPSCNPSSNPFSAIGFIMSIAFLHLLRSASLFLAFLDIASHITSLFAFFAALNPNAILPNINAFVPVVIAKFETKFVFPAAFAVFSMSSNASSGICHSYSKPFFSRYAPFKSSSTPFLVSRASTDDSAKPIRRAASSICAPFRILAPFAPLPNVLASLAPVAIALLALYKLASLADAPVIFPTIPTAPRPPVRYIVAIEPSEYPIPFATVSAQKLAVPIFWRELMFRSASVV